MPNLDLGVIGNGVVAALVDRRGRIVWQCLPCFDGDPVFCSCAMRLSKSWEEAFWRGW